MAEPIGAAPVSASTRMCVRSVGLLGTATRVTVEMASWSFTHALTAQGRQPMKIEQVAGETPLTPGSGPSSPSSVEPGASNCAWPYTPCTVCGTPTVDEGGYCSEKCLRTVEPEDSTGCQASRGEAQIGTPRDLAQSQGVPGPQNGGQDQDNAGNPGAVNPPPYRVKIRLVCELYDALYGKPLGWHWDRLPAYARGDGN